MSAVSRHLHVKLTEADAGNLASLRIHHAMETDSQLVRWLLRREARAIGLTPPEADPMPARGRPSKPKQGQRK